jgi:hypothetical protein
MMNETDPGMEIEAMENERFEVDLLMGQFEREGRRIAAIKRSGICTHDGMRPLDYRPGSRGWTPKAPYVCTEGTNGCAAQFANPDEWHEAHLRVVRS